VASPAVEKSPASADRISPTIRARPAAGQPETTPDLLALVTGSRQAPTAATTSSISSLVREAHITSMASAACSTIFLLDGHGQQRLCESNQGFDNQIIAIAPDSVAAVLKW